MKNFENEMKTILLSGCRMPDDLPKRVLAAVPATKPRVRKSRIWVAAALVALLVCGTAAGTLLWTRPDVQQHISAGNTEAKDSHTLRLGEDYITLPADALTEIAANADPDRMYNSFLTFASVTEWQSFCGLPLALSPDLVCEDTVDMIVSHRETETGPEPMMLIAITTAKDSDGRHYSLQLQANLSPDAGGSSTHSYTASTTTEITDYTTANGIPCVLCKVTDTEHGYVDVELYYTYAGVSYTVKCSAMTEEEADAVKEKMQALADSLEVVDVEG